MSEWEVVILGPRWNVRGQGLWSLSIHLRLKCPCGHEAVIDMNEVRSKYPAHQRLKEIEHKFSCRKCTGNREIIWSAVRKVE